MTIIFQSELYPTFTNRATGSDDSQPFDHVKAPNPLSEWRRGGSARYTWNASKELPFLNINARQTNISGDFFERVPLTDTHPPGAPLVPRPPTSHVPLRTPYL